MRAKSIARQIQNSTYQKLLSYGLLGIALLFCAGGTTRAQEEGSELHLWAPPQLEKALAELQAQNSGRRPLLAVSYGDSAALLERLAKGQPLDVVISGSSASLNALTQQALLRPAPPTKIAADRLVFVTAKDWELRRQIKAVRGVELAFEMGRRGLLALSNRNTEDGRIFKAALESLRMWSPALEDHLYEVNTNREAIALATSYEARLALVYQSEVADEASLRIVDTLPKNSHPPIVYAAAETASSQHPQAAELLARLHSPQARKIFEKHGLTRVR